MYSVSVSLLVLIGIMVSYAMLRYIGIILYRKIMKYPNGPVGIPFIGTALSFIMSPYDTLNVIGSYGKLTSVQLGLNRNIFINDISLSKKILSHKSIALYRPPIANLPHFKHFLVLNGDSWKKRREYFSTKLIDRISDSQYIYNNINNTINTDICDNIDNVIGHNKLWYPHNDCSFINFNLMFNGLFGINLSLNNDKTGYVSKLLPIPSLWFMSITRVLILAASVNFNVTSFIYDIFTKNHNKLEKDAGNLLIEFMKKYGDFEFNLKTNKLSRRINKSSYIDFLINESNLNLNEIISDIILILIAGTNTASKVIEYGFILLSQNESIQNEIYRELINIDNDSINNINKTNIFRAFIHEVLRLSVCSPLGIPHYAKQNVNINNKYYISKGSIIHNNMYYIHKSSQKQNIHIEYWLDNNNKFKMDNNRFIIFSYGGRRCPGKAVAMKSLYYVFSILIKKYKFISVNNNNDPIKQIFGTVPIIHPQIGIKVQKRNFCHVF